jgi:predicted CXXCH cytochrome family protein
VRNKLIWLIWICGTLLVAGAALGRLYIGGDRTDFLPGDTAGVHHQIEIACETCHVSKPFASQAKVRKDINKTCVTCHKEELKASNDSHPIKKFKNPRMASYWEKVDARFCTSCHSEHQPEITLAGLVTLPGDFCVACHSEGEQDVRVNRPTHAELTFDTCASSGCHNFHDNRSIYEDFLVKHAGQPWLKDQAIHPAEALARERVRPNADEIQVYLAAVSAPEQVRDIGVEAHWAASAHAAADVNCASCHAPKAETEDEIAAAWVEQPEEKICATCHKGEAKTFALGRHGMRRHPEIAKPRRAKKMLKRLGVSEPPEVMIAAIETYLEDPSPAPRMSTAEARIELKPETHGQEITCNTCHAPHEQNVTYAAVEACLTCHADDHTEAYEASAHHDLWQAELRGELPPGSGVTCATCHMPKSERKGVVTTNHNQNDTLRPNEKMIRPVCMECHSLEFAIDALADEDLVARNFSGSPDRHIESIDWAVSRVDQPDEGANQ